MSAPITLSALDKKILYHLDINAREPLSRLAKKVRASPAHIEYRLKRLEDKEFIKHYVTLLDAGKLGLMIWNVYFNLQNQTREEEERFIKHLTKQKNIWWVAKLAGSWNLVASLCVKNVKEFYEAVFAIHNQFGNIIQEHTIIAHAAISINSRGYFLKKAGISQQWYKTTGSIPLNKQDKAILKILSTNARLPSTEIAKRTGLTPRIVSYAIKRLQENGVISRCRLQLDVRKAGLQFFKIIVHLKNLSTKSNLALKEYCLNQGNIVHYEQKIGPWMLELELEGKDYATVHQQMQQMKESFHNFIKGYDVLLIIDEPKGELNLAQLLN